MKINRLKIIAAAAAAAVIALSLFMFFRPLEVSAVRTSRGEISSGVEEDGYVQPIDDRNLYATQNARIVEVPVEAGDAIVRGQLLVRMTNPDLNAVLAEVRTYSDQAEKSVSGYAAAVGSMRLLLADEKRTLERSKALFQAGAISRTELEQANLRVERVGKDLTEAGAKLASSSELRKGLRDQLGELEKKSAELIMKSPIDGYVLNLPAKEDQVVAPGDLVVGLAVRNEMEIRADVLSDALGNVEVG
ncbi:MAG: HlyD family efflux transporter periplasmic adaptor subunit, partial [Thermovirgaceae bacterium]|nr:HlyD family efflux transporter periplasmic adaptor subunit [Thermovirgaceae bacterium]